MPWGSRPCRNRPGFEPGAPELVARRPAERSRRGLLEDQEWHARNGNACLGRSDPGPKHMGTRRVPSPFSGHLGGRIPHAEHGTNRTRRRDTLSDVNLWRKRNTNLGHPSIPPLRSTTPTFASRRSRMANVIGRTRSTWHFGKFGELFDAFTPAACLHKSLPQPHRRYRRCGHSDGRPHVMASSVAKLKSGR